MKSTSTSTRLRGIALLPLILPVMFCTTACETPQYTEQGFDHYEVRQRWHDISSPETAPDYYGLPPSTPATTGNTAP